jgi:glycosyltransferase involved in cell wall biosynthesis
MKIVMFTDAYWPRVNGVTVSVDSFSRALIKKGHQVVIVCSCYPENKASSHISSVPTDGIRDEHSPILIRVPSFPALVSKEDRIAKFHKWFWLSNQLQEFKPDILHINSEFVIGEFGFYYGKLHKVPVVYTFHTLWEDYFVNYVPFVPDFFLKFVARKLIKNMASRADTIIAPSDQILEVLKRYKIKRPADLLPTGIDPDIFNVDTETAALFRETLEKKYPAICNRRILLFAGRIGKEKNLSFLLQIMPAILAKHPDVVLVIAGNGPELPDFVAEATSLGIASSCVFTGYMDRKHLACAYAIAEIFVFPSLTETQGLVTIESMLSGTPVVAIGAMGTINTMGGDNGGFMVKNDPDEFVARVHDLLDNRALYEEKAASAVRHAQAWTIDTMAARLEEIYQQTLLSYHGE